MFLHMHTIFFVRKYIPKRVLLKSTGQKTKKKTGGGMSYRHPGEDGTKH